MTFASLKRRFPHIALSLERGKFFNPSMLTFTRNGFTLRTSRYSYYISCNEQYLGCMASNNENGKGNDLSDGSNNAETWNDIVMDILSYELVIAN